MQDPTGIFYIIVLIMSVVLHELAHGYAALYFGDQTAKYAGRLTLNPLKHLDPFGSVILPLLLVLTNAPFLIGWAKPVPYNPENLTNKRLGTLWVASAGILTNLAIALFFGLIIRFVGSAGLLSVEFISLLSIIVLVNIVLAIFNLIPITPLDGSKILFSVLGRKSIMVERFMERYSLFLLIFFIVFLWDNVSPLIYTIFSLITGVNL
jgi:Zn-dependent protease